jgi:hypothetical protein
MDYEINDTKAYHIDHLDTLGWELTVCNALDPDASPCRRVLKRSDSYGHLLYDFLGRFIPMRSLRKVIEIGGGYGYLMRDFLDRDSDLQATMLDISPSLLERQRHTLGAHDVAYRLTDAMELEPDDLRSFDLAILNENMGDFPTMIDVRSDVFELSGCDLRDPLKRLRRIFERYLLEPPAIECFNLNIGAMETVEKLCSAGIPYIFLAEHSCEASVPGPLQRWIKVQATENPARIGLRGHDEYTIRFSFLEQIARVLQYETLRGPLADFIEFDFTERVRYIMQASATMTDEHEVIRHFIEDLYQYEYLILMKSR